MFAMVLLPFLLALTLTEAIQVCDNFDSYYHVNDKHCFDNEDAERNITEIISNWGFTAEEYLIYTKDGYQISIIRAYSNITRGAPLVLGHGILLNALSWVSRGNKSLAYHFGMRGYDMWMINFRGTVYSKGHRNISNYMTEYWSFSFHEMGIYDIASTMDLVMAKTKKKSIYVGFSMGSTVSYVYASKYPKEAESKLKAIVSLGPVAYFNNLKSIVKYAEPFKDLLKSLIYTLFNGELRVPDPLLYIICGIHPWQMRLCSIFRSLVFGIDLPQIDPLYIRLIYTLLGEGTGVEVLNHYAQIYGSGEFREKDFGESTNLEKYGQKLPPYYNLSKISVPVSLLIGNNDLIAMKENAVKIYSNLNVNSRGVFKVLSYKKFAHNDFIEAKDIIRLLYRTLQEILEPL